MGHTASKNSAAVQQEGDQQPNGRVHHLQTSQPQLETSSQGLYSQPSNISTSAGNLSSRFVYTTFKHLNLSWKPLFKVCVHHLQTPQPQLETSSQGLCPPPSNTSTSAGNLFSRFVNPCERSCVSNEAMVISAPLWTDIFSIPFHVAFSENITKTYPHHHLVELTPPTALSNFEPQNKVAPFQTVLTNHRKGFDLKAISVTSSN